MDGEDFGFTLERPEHCCAFCFVHDARRMAQRIRSDKLSV
jgi:hypothetical protein